MIDGFRFCSRCATHKPYDAFHNGRRVSWCKTCYSEYGKLNRKYYNAAYYRWQKRNPDKVAANTRAYLAKKAQAMPRWADEKAILGLYAEAQRLSTDTGIPHEVDHIVPLNSDLVCGLHVHFNLRVITREENRDKSNLLKENLLCPVA